MKQTCQVPHSATHRKIDRAMKSMVPIRGERTRFAKACPELVIRGAPPERITSVGGVVHEQGHEAEAVSGGGRA